MFLLNNFEKQESRQHMSVTSETCLLDNKNEVKFRVPHTTMTQQAELIKTDFDEF